MYELYKFDKCAEQNDIKIEDTYSLKRYKPSIFKLAIPAENISMRIKCVRLYFSLISANNLELYYVKYKEQIVHVSYVIHGRCLGKFPFMRKGDVEIGPCYTNAEHRGKKIYPYVLKNILKDNIKDSTDFYMIIDDKNSASINGVSKCNFVKIAKLDKTSILKRYITKEK